MRVERIEKILDYDKAFDYLTKFYRRKAVTTSGIQQKGGDEIDLTGDSESGGDDLEMEAGGMHNEAEANPIELATGLPCKYMLRSLY